MSVAAVAEPTTNTVNTFFTKWEHGGVPVTRCDKGEWVIHYPDGKQQFSSGRALMRAIHNGRDPHLQVERYFKAGKWAKKKSSACGEVGEVITGVFPGQLTTLDLFGIKGDEIKNKDISSVSSSVSSSSTKKKKADKKKTSPLSHGVGQLGIDLVNRAHEVRKLLFAGFGSRIVAMGYDPEDVLQDVYKGLLARNLGTCPWDGQKSSFGHYVHMVCGCILSNYHRKYNRINQNERTGVFMMRDGGSCEVDLAESNLCVERESQGDHIDEDEMVLELFDAIRLIEDDGVLEDGVYNKRDVSLDVLPLLVQGWKRREIARELGIREGIITKCINLIRRAAKDTWDVSPTWT